MNDICRITASITPMATMLMNREALTLRICTTRRNVCISSKGPCSLSYLFIAAKKDDNPEEALKEFRAIVDQEEEQGDW